MTASVNATESLLLSVLTIGVDLRFVAGRRIGERTQA